jgi:hypothetical protein
MPIPFVKKNTSDELNSLIGQHELQARSLPVHRTVGIQHSPPQRSQRVRYTTRPRIHQTTLFESLGLRFNPFAQGVTEQELELNFAEIYVEPEASLLNTLERVTSVFVFADYGMGKSATRLALEYLLRSTPGEAPTLAVRYTPKVWTDRTETLDDHLRAIAHELAIDAVIQTLERCASTTTPLTDQYVVALRRQAALLPHRLRAQIQAAIKHPPTGGTFWAPIRPAEWISLTPRWYELVQIMALGASEPEQQRTSWMVGIEDTYALGFGRIFVLVDAVDEADIDPGQLLSFLTPLFDHVPDLQKQGVFIKCFLPLELESHVQFTFKSAFDYLTVPPTTHRIKAVSPSNLQQILSSRLQAVRQPPHGITTLDQLAGPGVTESFQAWLAEQAQGSPRDVVVLADQLLDFHAQHGYRDDGRLHLRLDEWRAFQEEARQHASPT